MWYQILTLILISTNDGGALARCSGSVQQAVVIEGPSGWNIKPIAISEVGRPSENNPIHVHLVWRDNAVGVWDQKNPGLAFTKFSSQKPILYAFYIPGTITVGTVTEDGIDFWSLHSNPGQNHMFFLSKAKLFRMGLFDRSRWAKIQSASHDEDGRLVIQLSNGEITTTELPASVRPRSLPAPRDQRLLGGGE